MENQLIQKSFDFKAFAKEISKDFKASVNKLGWGLIDKNGRVKQWELELIEFNFSIHLNWKLRHW